MYAVANGLNNLAERHFRNRIIDKIYLTLPNAAVPDVISNESIKKADLKEDTLA